MSKVLCVDGIPSRGLFSGQVYEMLDYWACCGIKPFPLISVDRSAGRTKPCVCSKCKKTAPRGANGWYDSRRFVPLKDPDELKITQREVEELYSPSPIEVTTE